MRIEIKNNRLNESSIDERMIWVAAYLKESPFDRGFSNRKGVLVASSAMCAATKKEALSILFNSTDVEYLVGCRNLHECTGKEQRMIGRDWMEDIEPGDFVELSVGYDGEAHSKYDRDDNYWDDDYEDCSFSDALKDSFDYAGNYDSEVKAYCARIAKNFDEGLKRRSTRSFTINESDGYDSEDDIWIVAATSPLQTFGVNDEDGQLHCSYSICTVKARCKDDALDALYKDEGFDSGKFMFVNGADVASNRPEISAMCSRRNGSIDELKEKVFDYGIVFFEFEVEDDELTFESFDEIARLRADEIFERVIELS